MFRRLFGKTETDAALPNLTPLPQEASERFLVSFTGDDYYWVTLPPQEGGHVIAHVKLYGEDITAFTLSREIEEADGWSEDLVRATFSTFALGSSDVSARWVERLP